MNYRDKLKKLYQSNKDPSLQNEYKKLRNEICSEIKEAKRQYFDKKLNTNNSKEAWSTAFHILNKPTNSFPHQMVIRNEVMSKPEELAEEMNKFFVNKITKLKEAQDIELETESASKELKQYLKYKSIVKEDSTFKLQEINDEEMKKLIKKM